MTRVTDSPHLPATSNTDVAVSVDGHVCPFCGLTREITDEFDPNPILASGLTTPLANCASLQALEDTGLLYGPAVHKLTLMN